MDNCTKLKLFNLLLVLCAVNFVLYRFFAGDSATHAKVISMNARRDVGEQKSGGPEEGKIPDLKDIEFPVPKSSDGEGDGGGGKAIKTSTKTGAVADSDKGDQAVDGSKTQPGVVDPGTPQDGGRGDNPKAHSGAGDLRNQPEAGKTADTGPALSGTGVGGEKAEDTRDKTADGGSDKDEQGEDVDTGANGTTEEISMCPATPPNLTGYLATFRDAKSFEEIGRDNPKVRLGGRYAPSTCTAQHRVAIVIPYRNREEHLKVLMRNLHPMLQRQQLDYGIFVIEQALPGRFNRAMLMNIGFVEAMKRHDYQCAVFHDVDLIPEDDRNIYSCPQQPRHLSASIDKFNYKLPYAGIYGGVSAINKKQFHELNGFSNLYFGWGGEDDDMAKRLSMKGYKITRYPMQIARYKMIQHKREKFNEVNPKRFELLRTTTRRQPWDGLNSLVYTVQEVEELPTHTLIKVLIREEDLKSHA